VSIYFLFTKIIAMIDRPTLSKPTGLTRRSFLHTAGRCAVGGALLGGFGLSTVSRSLAQATRPTLDLLPTPDFSPNQVLRYVAGIRPYREKSIRLELERIEDRVLVHNYGHGGGGITMAPGCAEEVTQLLAQASVAPTDIAVLGGGINGMTCAHDLLQLGHRVTIYSDKLTPHTTSDVAGGQFSPSFIRFGEGDEAKARADRMMIASYRRYGRLLGDEWGVYERDNYGVGEPHGSTSRLPAGLLPPVKRFDRLPFQGDPRPGYMYRTLLITPPIYLPRLLKEIKSLGGRTVRRKFSSLRRVMKLDEKVIVNCLGLGAGKVMDDPAVIPFRGQLVHLKPQDLPYLLVGHGYIFPRPDAVVLGGTMERDVTSTRPDKARCKKILERNRSFFMKSKPKTDGV
jgi:glycine/D-amino acid oxidase-like deaminating enzyme